MKLIKINNKIYDVKNREARKLDELFKKTIQLENVPCMNDSERKQYKETLKELDEKLDKISKLEIGTEIKQIYNY